MPTTSIFLIEIGPLFGGRPQPRFFSLKLDHFSGNAHSQIQDGDTIGRFQALLVKNGLRENPCSFHPAKCRVANRKHGIGGSRNGMVFTGMDEKEQATGA